MNSRGHGWTEERIFFCITALAVSLGLAGGLFLANFGKSRLIKPDHPRQLVGFTLIDQTGRSVTSDELNGKILVVSFVFTGCSTTCPLVHKQMARIQGLVANQPGVRLVSLAVDPRTDTPPVLEKFAAQFGAQTNRWLFLTGDKKTLQTLIETSFLENAGPGGYDPMPGGFADSERIAVVDSFGRLRGFFDGLNPDTPAAVAAEIGRLKTKS